MHVPKEGHLCAQVYVHIFEGMHMCEGIYEARSQLRILVLRSQALSFETGSWVSLDLTKQLVWLVCKTSSHMHLSISALVLEFQTCTPTVHCFLRSAGG